MTGCGANQVSVTRDDLIGCQLETADRDRGFRHLHCSNSHGTGRYCRHGSRAGDPRQAETDGPEKGFTRASVAGLCDSQAVEVFGRIVAREVGLQ